MARYRNALPQLKGDLFLTDGGIETTLIFQQQDIGDNLQRNGALVSLTL